MTRLEKTVIHLGRAQVFKEATPGTTVNPESFGMGLIDAEGNHTGTMERPLSVRDPNTEEILAQLLIMNHHLAALTGETFSPEG